MKIGIDLHGVVDSDPTFFKKLLTYMTICDIEMYIVSGPPKTEIINELNELGFKKRIHYKEVYSIVDFLKESGVRMSQDKYDRWWSNEEDWCKSKARICDRHSISCMIDDKEMYKSSFEHTNCKFLLFV